MKRGVATVVCLVFLMASAVAVEVLPIRCDIGILKPCLEATKDPRVLPSKDCCKVLIAFFQVKPQQLAIDCLCKLASSMEARRLGVQFNLAISLPQKCGIRFDKKYLCPFTGPHLPSPEH